MSCVDFRKSLLNWAEKHQFKLSNSFVNNNDTFSIYHALFDEEYNVISSVKATEDGYSTEITNGAEYWYEEVIEDVLTNILDNSWGLDLCEFLDDEQTIIEVVLASSDQETYRFELSIDDEYELSDDFFEQIKLFSLRKTELCIIPMFAEETFNLIGLNKQAADELQQIEKQLFEEFMV